MCKAPTSLHSINYNNRYETLASTALPSIGCSSSTVLLPPRAVHQQRTCLLYADLLPRRYNELGYWLQRSREMQQQQQQQ
jgi:hypothetical protein